MRIHDYGCVFLAANIQINTKQSWLPIFGHGKFLLFILTVEI